MNIHDDGSQTWFVRHGKQHYSIRAVSGLDAMLEVLSIVGEPGARTVPGGLAVCDEQAFRADHGEPTDVIQL